MVEDSLPGDIVVHWFNPWLFESTSQLIEMYFNELAAKLKLSTGAASRELRRVLKKYGTALLSAPTLETLMVGKAMQALGALTGVPSSLDAKRKKIEKALERPDAPRVVVMVDDVDRLDPHGVPP